MDNFDDLYNIIKDRIKNLPRDSYTASLVKGGKNRISQKVGEETMELIIETTKDEYDKRAIIDEASDLLFHFWVLMAIFKITPNDILNELKVRHNSRINIK